MRQRLRPARAALHTRPPPARRDLDLPPATAPTRPPRLPAGTPAAPSVPSPWRIPLCVPSPSRTPPTSSFAALSWSKLLRALTRTSTASRAARWCACATGAVCTASGRCIVRGSRLGETLSFSSSCPLRTAFSPETRSATRLPRYRSGAASRRSLLVKGAPSRCATRSPCATTWAARRRLRRQRRLRRRRRHPGWSRLRRSRTAAGRTRLRLRLRLHRRVTCALRWAGAPREAWAGATRRMRRAMRTQTALGDAQSVSEALRCAPPFVKRFSRIFPRFPCSRHVPSLPTG